MLYRLNWFSSYRLLLQWQALRFKPVLPLTVIFQLLGGVCTVIGMGYIVPEIDATSAKYLVTGGPTITLIGLGLTIMPQMVAQAKTQGTYNYMWSLPIPRLVFLAADMTIWLLATIPGVMVALAVGSLRYGFDLQISLLVVPAFLLVALMATSVGYALAHMSPKPELAIMLTNFIIFSLFLFSPINFPVERLPGWLADLHRFLPVKYAADVVRGTLTEGRADGLAFVVLGAWCLLGMVGTYAVVTRKG
jgi:ABC-2 type transport system permease protein